MSRIRVYVQGKSQYSIPFDPKRCAQNVGRASQCPHAPKVRIRERKNGGVEYVPEGARPVDDQGHGFCGVHDHVRSQEKERARSKVEHDRYVARKTSEERQTRIEKAERAVVEAAMVWNDDVDMDVSNLALACKALKKARES